MSKKNNNSNNYFRRLKQFSHSNIFGHVYLHRVTRHFEMAPALWENDSFPGRRRRRRDIARVLHKYPHQTKSRGSQSDSTASLCERSFTSVVEFVFHVFFL